MLTLIVSPSLRPLPQVSELAAFFRRTRKIIGARPRARDVLLARLSEAGFDLPLRNPSVERWSDFLNCLRAHNMWWKVGGRGVGGVGARASPAQSIPGLHPRQFLPRFSSAARP